MALRLGFDVLGLATAVLVASEVASSFADEVAGAGLAWLVLPLTLAFLACRGLYRPNAPFSILDGLGVIAGATSLAAMTLIVLLDLLTPDARPALVVAPLWLCGTVILSVDYLLLGRIRSWARRQAVSGKPTLIVGAGHVGARVHRRLTQRRELGLVPVGFLDSNPPVTEHRDSILGHPSDLEEVLETTGAKHVIFAFLAMPDSALLPLVRRCEERRVEFSIVPRLFETTNSRIELEHLGGLPLFSMRRVDPKGWQFWLKHAGDRVVAAALLLCLAPLLIVVAVAIAIESGRPLMFRQTRIGRDGSEFTLFKFRTMACSPVHAPQTRIFATEVGPGGIEGEDTRTRVGKLLRRTSLDELPQLVNVVLGQMSLVGPRPERPDYVRVFGDQVERYTDRHRVKSGITGWAQVHGLRGKTSLADRVEWDNYYIENWSLWLDLKILLMTVAAVFQPTE